MDAYAIPSFYYFNELCNVLELCLSYFFRYTVLYVSYRVFHSTPLQVRAHVILNWITSNLLRATPYADSLRVETDLFAADSELERNIVTLSLEHHNDCHGCIDTSKYTHTKEDFKFSGRCMKAAQDPAST